jgi:pilus assembly protein Flp/PilA
LQLINAFIGNLYAMAYNLREKREEGQTLVEYALIIALVAIVLVVALETLAGGIEGTFDTITEELGGAGGS